MELFMKLHWYNDLNQLIWFFWEKLSLEVFEPKGAQNEVFQVLQKIDCMNFSDFLPKIKTIQSLKVDFSDFLGKIWFQGFWAKRGKMGQEWGFSSFVKNEQLNFFWI